jgi:hypothetical protein
MYLFLSVSSHLPLFLSQSHSLTHTHTHTHSLSLSLSLSVFRDPLPGRCAIVGGGGRALGASCLTLFLCARWKSSTSTTTARKPTSNPPAAQSAVGCDLDAVCRGLDLKAWNASRNPLRSGYGEGSEMARKGGGGVCLNRVLGPRVSGEARCHGIARMETMSCLGKGNSITYTIHGERCAIEQNRVLVLVHTVHPPPPYGGHGLRFDVQTA